MGMKIRKEVNVVFGQATLKKIKGIMEERMRAVRQQWQDQPANHERNKNADEAYLRGMRDLYLALELGGTITI